MIELIIECQQKKVLLFIFYANKNDHRVIKNDPNKLIIILLLRAYL